MSYEVMNILAPIQSRRWKYEFTNCVVRGVKKNCHTSLVSLLQERINTAEEAHGPKPKAYVIFKSVLVAEM